MRRYLFSSHDGFGLGHTRRNTLIARALLARDPQASVTLVTGVALRPSWLGHDRMQIVAVPPLLKGRDGEYRSDVLDFETALERRAETFERAVREFEPTCVVVDRHPYGIGGELVPGLERARRQGAAIVLGLRDVLDEPSRVRVELAGHGWDGVADRFDEVLVYGDRVVADHAREYGLPIRPHYCGWVVDRIPRRRRDHTLVTVAAGGGGDGDGVFELGLDLAGRLPNHRFAFVAGPYATAAVNDAVANRPELAGRVRLLRDVPGCASLFALSGAVVEMAGYNSTVEAIAAGIRPILVPRRAPRREQAIRATRLAALGLADVVDDGAPVDEVLWWFRRSRTLDPAAVRASGVRLHGARRAAARLEQLALVVDAR